MRKYVSFFRIRFTTGLQYRTAALAGVLTQFVWGFMEILMFQAFYKADLSAFPMTLPQLSSYVWLQQAFLAAFMLWFFDRDILTAVSQGNIAYELARPMGLYGMWFTKSAAVRLSRTVLRCMPILVIAAFLPKPYGLSAPPSVSAFLLFLLTAVLAVLTVVSYSMLIYIGTFYTTSPDGLRVIAVASSDFLTGGLIPLPFMPYTLRRVIELSPFGGMQNLPLRVFSGNIAGKELWIQLLVQVFWLLALVIFGKLWMRAAVRRVTVQGG